ncbi:NADH-ubiquinone oxidoreductase [Aneurinibacillus migulanus]|uniref:NADH-ubiquinone oxidoreductase n=1 Tax=Aneurinibacillus migulanus TaxID=47500 RepID=A0A0D1YDJ7_ANEMI|nr:SDR family NAD(P)-dependent oxidoreductase [Aneurinibacillus migulanus]KIV51121.1 NADH-ubiquinone oxidoreductase [Aneurinibacillus migulanus]KIV57052.1 NADH-ubiquinone oxidoreductase [Aneurinibacillus migulanus]KON93231.1 NADH-ubiquinone oxidoreductase [Aneurinibacillus migulanus]KPD09462.1 NADH-ubiquinone oxidoreductase [Aneurinibacillus migulanus]MED0893076.1 SDR family NAD(P)-dependent oxidoreductase [Aneurinibacillus migulanus]
MKKALVLGASGGMGYALVKELAEQGVQTVALARTEEKLNKLFKEMENVHIMVGNVNKLEDIMNAGKGVDVIFHAVNIPYPEWATGQSIIMGNVLTAVEALNVKLAIVDNIYAYGRGNGEEIVENYPKRPHTKKGNIRLEMERMVNKAREKGVQALTAHFPDFYGPHATNTVLHYTLESILSGKRAIFVGRQDVEREYIFTPDGAKALIALAMQEEAYGQNWNIPGYGVISGHEIITIAREMTDYRGKVMTVGKGMITFIGLFNKAMWEVREMMYLMEEPVILSGKKYETQIGPLPRTPYEEGIRQTLEWMKGA